MDFDALRLRFATLDLYRLSTAVAGIEAHISENPGNVLSIPQCGHSALA